MLTRLSEGSDTSMKALEDALVTDDKIITLLEEEQGGGLNTIEPSPKTEINKFYDNLNFNTPQGRAFNSKLIWSILVSACANFNK